MFDREGFRVFFFRQVGDSQNTLHTYNSYLGRIDQAVGGLDEHIASDGGEALLDWMASAQTEPFATHRSQCRSITRAYLRYRSGLPAASSGEAEEPTAQENAASVFRFERELQAAVRVQLGSLEAGLTIEDGGYEAAFDTGRPDILARDAQGRAVVIELKAGPCPKGAIEQVLGYAQNWIDEGEPTVRCIIVAGEFSARQRSAVKLVPGLELKTYRLAVQFAEA
jgi:hypothetical protein